MRRNLVISFVQRHIQLLVTISSVMILSRLVSPEETGVFSIGVAIAALTHVIRDFGVGNFLVKEADISLEKIRTAFTVSLLIAVALSLVLLGISFPVADFYNEPRAATVIWITTLGLLISPFSTIALTLMLREQRFVDMFKVSISASFANACVAILFGWLGFGAKALALGQLAQAVMLVLAANLIRRDGSIYRLSLAYWRDISRFGFHMTVSGISDQMGQRASDLVVGKMVGFSAVGLLSRSGTLVTMVQDSMLSVMPVLLTTMSENARKNGNVAPMLLSSLGNMSGVMWPVYAVISLFAYDAIAVLFGAKWLEAAPLTSVLCYGAVFAVMSVLVNTTCNATNNAHLLSRYSPAVQGMRVLLVTLGAMTADLGVVVRLLVLAEMLQATLAYFIFRRIAGIRFIQVVQHCWRSLLVAALVAAAVFPLRELDCAPLLRLMVVGVCAALVWVAALYLSRHPLSAEISNAWGVLNLRMRAAR
ncbi:oligosaccharide flippase family protein [Massilia alkalitolerans]|uniref:oligosaccharide flippase family protein n=1 Tax=Massilia alkalitolerans TaxID=286638 RepID=UPI0028A9A49B|nr:oligosaccharide flippase family protein [Massilia alkalitolerans]